jgi:dihydroorotase
MSTDEPKDGTELLIRGRVFARGNLQHRTVRIRGGSISDVLDGELTGGRSPGVRALDLKDDQILVPAGVDALSAMRDWGEHLRDTVETVTKAALSGGVTVVCDQPNTMPRINTPELVRKRSNLCAEHSYTDFGISAHPPVEAKRIDEYRDAGAFSLTLFSWDLKPWNEPRDTDDSAARFQQYANQGLKATVFVDEHSLRETSLREESEAFALEALLRRLVPDLHCQLYVTLPESVERIRSIKDRLPNVRVQTGPQWLLISREAAYAKIGSAAFMTPPLRSQAATDRMRALAAEGALDIVVAHHTPHRTVDKYSAAPRPGEFTPKAGYSTMDYTFPLLLTRLGIEQACRVYCESPARVLGLKKGLIAPGYEADLAVLETAPAPGAAENSHVHGEVLADPWRVDPSDFQSKSIVTPFIGDQLQYRVLKTFIRGEEAFDRATMCFTRRAVRQLR